MRNGISYSDAGKLGALKSKEKTQKLKEGRILKYNNTPTVCTNCGSTLDYKHRHNKFCNPSCSASYTNRGKHGINLTNCMICGKKNKNSKSKYCSNICSHIGRWNNTKIAIEQGKYKTNTTSSVIKKYLLEKFGVLCSKCGLKTWQGHTIPLNVHHKDGDSTNNIPENIELVCLNCHALTENYGAKNKKSTRLYRYKII